MFARKTFEETRNQKEVFNGHIYHASSPTQTKGIMLSLSKAIPWVSKKVILDKQDCYTVLWGMLNQINLTIVEYMPHVQRAKFWNMLVPSLHEDIKNGITLERF